MPPRCSRPPRHSDKAPETVPAMPTFHRHFRKINHNRLELARVSAGVRSCDVRDRRGCVDASRRRSSYRTAISLAYRTAPAHHAGRAAASRRAGAATRWPTPDASSRLGPIAFWVVVGTLVIMAVWTITTATYFAFREDVLTAAHRPAGRDAVRLRGPHRRAARAGRPHLEPPAARPGAVRAEARPDPAPAGDAGVSAPRALSGCPTPTSPARSGRRARGEPRGRRRVKPSPINDNERSAACPAATRRSIRAPARHRTRGGVGGGIARLQASLDRVEQRAGGGAQFDRGDLRRQGAAHPRRARRARRRRRQASRRATAARIGGPFVAARLPKRRRAASSASFTASASRAPRSTGSPRTLGTVPVRKPVDRRDRSGVGLRRAHRSVHRLARRCIPGSISAARPAMPVRATADGTVTAAGWSGGYGRVVDVDHGNGFPPATGTCPRSTCEVGQIGEDRPDRRQGRLDRALDRPAPALRDAGRAARRSIRRSSCAPERGSTAAI